MAGSPGTHHNLPILNALQSHGTWSRPVPGVLRVQGCSVVLWRNSDSPRPLSRMRKCGDPPHVQENARRQGVGRPVLELSEGVDVRSIEGAESGTCDRFPDCSLRCPPGFTWSLLRSSGEKERVTDVPAWWRRRWGQGSAVWASPSEAALPTGSRRHSDDALRASRPAPESMTATWTL
jgi:hypothetical protein